jgi:hypothetical protein
MPEADLVGVPNGERVPSLKVSRTLEEQHVTWAFMGSAIARNSLPTTATQTGHPETITHPRAGMPLAGRSL